MPFFLSRFSESYAYRKLKYVGLTFNKNYKVLFKDAVRTGRWRTWKNISLGGTTAMMLLIFKLTLRRLMSYIYIYIYIYIYGAPILDVSRSHTTTQHSR